MRTVYIFAHATCNACVLALDQSIKKFFLLEVQIFIVHHIR